MAELDDPEVDDDLGLALEDEGASEESPGGDSKPAPEPDDGGGPVVAAGGAPEDDDADYSTRVRKRIDKEVYRRKAAEERESRTSAELAALRADLDAIKSRNAAADARAADGTLQERLTAAQQRLRKAKEEGDIDGEIKASDEYDDLKAQKRATEWQRQSAPAPASPAPTTPPLAVGTSQWLARNPWYLSGQNPRLAALAAELDVELQQEGYSPADPAMYAELNGRLKAAMPRAASLIGEVAAPPPRKRDAGPPSGTSSPYGGAPAKKRSLTGEDLAEMQTYGMNPQSKEDRIAWLRTHA
jgi:hypothetical protein